MNEGDEEIRCSYCNGVGHYSNQCEKNPNRRTRCTKCGRMGHDAASCWARQPRQDVRILENAKSESRTEETHRNNGGPGPNSGGTVTFVQELDDCVTASVDNQGTKRLRGNDGNPVGRTRSMGLPEIPRPDRREVAKASPPKKAKKITSRKSKQARSSVKDLASFVKKYNLLAEFSAAPCGITFGQLLRGDADEARLELRKLIRSTPRNRLFASPVTTAPKRLMLIPIKMQGEYIQALLDSGAVPNLMSTEIATDLSLKIEPTTKKITVADGTMARCRGVVSDLPVHMDRIVCPMDFLVVDKPPVNVIIGMPTMETLRTRIDLGLRTVRLSFEGRTTEISLEHERMRPIEAGNETASEDFTSSDDSLGSSSDSSSDQEGLVATMGGMNLDELNGPYPTMEKQIMQSSNIHTWPIPTDELEPSRNSMENYPESEGEDIVGYVSESNPKKLEENRIKEELTILSPMGDPTARMSRKGSIKSNPELENLGDTDKAGPIPEERSVKRQKTAEERVGFGTIDISNTYLQQPVEFSTEEMKNHLKLITELQKYDMSILENQWCNTKGSPGESSVYLEGGEGRTGELTRETGHVEMSGDRTEYSPDPSAGTSKMFTNYAGEDTYPALLVNLVDSGEGDKGESPGLMEKRLEQNVDSTYLGLTGDDNAIESSGQVSPGPPSCPTGELLTNLSDEQRVTLEATVSHIEEEFKAPLVEKLLRSGIMAWGLHDLRPAETPVEHSFDLTNHEPIYHRPRRLSPKDNEEVYTEVQRMLHGGVIVPSSSNWSFPTVIARKQDGGPRFCVDYRRLNDRMKSDVYPIPNMEEIIEDMQGYKIFSTIDLFSGYWQIPMRKEFKDLTTFTCKYGTYRFEVMPFGLKNAPATFQRMMSKLLKDVPFARVYLDDVVIFSKNAKDHASHVAQVLEIIHQANLKLKLKKCCFFQRRVELLGHYVSGDGVEVDATKTDRIAKAPTPSSKSELRSFLGMCSYYRRFIKGFARVASPLHAGTTPKNTFKWNDEMEEAFNKLKERLCSPPILAYPNYEKQFFVETDASSVAVGAVLAQKDEKGSLHPVQFASRTMSAHERNYSVCEKEALAVIFALKKFRIYLLSNKKFKLLTDHQALKYAFKKKDVHGRLARWLDFLAEYNFDIEYRPGEENGPADYLSRSAPEEDGRGVEINQITALAVIPENRDYEAELCGIIDFLSSNEIDKTPRELRPWVKRHRHHYLLWDHQLFKRTGHGLRTVPSQNARMGILKAFHDSIGHWDPQTTAQFVLDRFWWPGCRKDIVNFVRSCESCQRFAPIPKYRTTLRIPVTSLFSAFSLDFAGPLPETTKGNKFVLIGVEHLTNWPIAIATPNSTAEVVINFVRDEIVRPFGPPKRIISDNATCFKAGALEDFVRKLGIQWHTVLPYAPMSNGKAERMVGTIKSGVKRVCDSGAMDWDEALPQVLFGYRRRRGPSGFSPFELLFGQAPRMTAQEHPDLTVGETENSRKSQLIATAAWRATRSNPKSNPRESIIAEKVIKYQVGDKVLVAHGQAVASPATWPSFKSKYYGPCTVMNSKHPYYELKSQTGRHTREGIHARRLRIFKPRLPAMPIMETPAGTVVPTTDYLSFVIAQRTLNDWLDAEWMGQEDKLCAAYGLIHIFLSFNKIKEGELTNDDFALLTEIIRCYDHPLVEQVGEYFINHFLHYIVGRYGEIDDRETCLETITAAVERLEGNTDLWFQNNGRVAFLLAIPQHRRFTLVPWPLREYEESEPTDSDSLPCPTPHNTEDEAGPVLMIQHHRFLCTGCQRNEIHPPLQGAPEGMILNQDYLGFWVAGRTLQAWLDELLSSEVTYEAKQIHGYHLFHFSLALYGLWNDGLIEEFQEELDALLKHYDKALYESLTAELRRYIFYFAVGRFGHLIQDHSKKSQIRDLLIHIKTTTQNQGEENSIRLIKVNLQAQNETRHAVLGWPFASFPPFVQSEPV